MKREKQAYLFIIGHTLSCVDKYVVPVIRIMLALFSPQGGDSIYWDIRECLSYNCLFNFIIGPRGVGKTFATKKYTINNFINKNEQFVYLRRYKTEFAKIKKFFGDIETKYPEQEFAVNADFKIDGKTAGTYYPLSKMITQKSVPFPYTTSIVFDEFIIDKGCIRYLTNEVETFLEAYSTIARDRDVKVFFLSNAITEYNPYFLYFNIEPTSRITRRGDIYIERVEAPEFTEHMNNSRFGKLIQGTDYADYAFNNVSLRDNNYFIREKSGKCKYLFTIKTEQYLLGIWENRNIYYLSEDVQTNAPIMAIDIDSFTPEIIYADKFLIKLLEKAFKESRLYYESQKIKSIANKILRKVVK